MSEYYYDFGWQYEDNIDTAYRSGQEKQELPCLRDACKR